VVAAERDVAQDRLQYYYRESGSIQHRGKVAPGELSQ